MEIDYPPDTIRATPEFVLSVFQDIHRQQCQYDPAADPLETLAFDTTVAQWRDACDLRDWSDLGRAMNDEWRIHCTRRQWKSALCPPKERTLRNVCDLIAAHAKRDLIRPAHFLGAPCVTAGAFLTIRWLLAEAGANADAITPSAPIAPFARKYLGAFIGRISRLAPGAPPPVHVETPTYHAMGCGFIISVLAFFVGQWVSPWLVLLAAPAAGFFWIAMWVAARIQPKVVEFGELRTFRDLARVIASQCLTNPPSPPPAASSQSGSQSP